MTSRERVLMALNHEEPDRVPIDLWFTREVEARLAADHGGLRKAELRAALGHDILTTASPNVGASYEIPGSSEEYVCEWGIRWRWVTNAAGGRYTEAVEHPLAGAEDLNSYQVPDPLSARMQTIYREGAETVERYSKTHVIFGSLYQTVFEAAWLLRGMENLMVDMKTNKDFAHALFDRLVGYSLTAGRELIARGVDVIWVGDDFGGQHAMLISPETWREFFKPRYAQLIQAFKRQNHALKIAYHSDGCIEPIIPELIEIGVDILNPIQPLCMAPSAIKRKYGDQLSFWGTVDVQQTFPFGSPKDVECEVRERLRTVAPVGGLILCSAHAVQPDTPAENIRTFYRAAHEWGRYPIRA